MRSNVFKLFFIFSAFISTLNSSTCFAQTTSKVDSIPIDKAIHSPKRATIYSAILPGLGQIYNKKYWKVPVIYAGMGACTYLFFSNNNEYSNLKDELQYRFLQDSLSLNPKYTSYSDQNLISLKNYYQRNRELSLIVGILFYALNIIDASVDAHLFSFDVSDDLSLNVMPYSMFDPRSRNSRLTNGFTLTLKF